jgi:hypothetical protein
MNKKFLLPITLFFVSFALLNDFFVESGKGLTFFHDKSMNTNLFFYLLTVLLHFVGVYTNKNFKQSFAQVYLLIIATRLFTSLSYFLIVYSYHYDSMMAFTLNFLFLYFCYTLFEISSLIANLRPHLKS